MGLGVGRGFGGFAFRVSGLLGLRCSLLPMEATHKRDIKETCNKTAKRRTLQERIPHIVQNRNPAGSRQNKESGDKNKDSIVYA
jgi:hypothetical protein